MADPGGAAPLLFLDQTEARRTKKILLAHQHPPLPLSQGLDPALGCVSPISIQGWIMCSDTEMILSYSPLVSQSQSLFKVHAL